MCRLSRVKSFTKTFRVEVRYILLSIMQHLHNRKENQLSSGVAHELSNYGKGAWVNQAYTGSPPPVNRNISTVYNPQPMFHSSLENMNHMNMPNPYSAVDKVQTYPAKEKSGCCSAFFKGERKLYDYS